MAGNSSVSVSTCPARLSSSVITTTRSSSNFLPCLPPRPKAKLTLVRALSADTGHNQLLSSSETKNPLAVVLDVPRKFWRQTLHPLSDFGVEVNQSGLLMETLIDITPSVPIPKPSVGPLDPECVKEGQIVCDRQ